MDIAKFFTREEVVSGIEVSDNALRLVVLEKQVAKTAKDKKPAAGGEPREEKISVKIAVEELLPAGVVEGGLVKNVPALATSLKSLLKKSQPKIKYAILTIPMDSTYSKVFAFPKNIQGERLEESMKLTIGFQLPVKTEDVYLDWESIRSSDKNEIILAAAPKNVVNDYIGAFRSGGITVIAVEMNASSVGRSMEALAKDAVLIKNATPSSTQIFVLKKGIPYFIRVLENRFVPAEKVEEEIRKISDFFEAEEGHYPEEVNLSDARILYELYNHPTIKENNGKWLASAGAAIRGLMPRAEDTLISLMPIGTEEAYAYQKAVTFVDFLSKMTIGLSVFFVAIFTGLWFFMVSVQQGILRDVESISTVPVSQESAQLEAKAQKVNGLVGAIGVFVKVFPRWEGVLEEIRARIAPGIFITSAGLKSPDQPITLSGIAQNRDQLNMFKRFLEGSTMFSGVDIPLTNLGMKENIPFTVSLRIKDPAAVYKR